MKPKRNASALPKPAGYLLLAACLIGSSVIPELSILDPRSFAGIANLNLPYGEPEAVFGNLAKEPLFQSIIDNGAQVIFVKTIEPEPIKNTAGLWIPSEGTMKLKIGSFTYQQYMQVLRHEAIHMAQSCKNNSIKAEPIKLGLPVTRQGLNKLEPYKKSNPEYFLSEIEREAHSNDIQSDQFVIKLLDFNVFSTLD